MTTRTAPQHDIQEESGPVRDCRLTIIRALSQRTSTKVPWYRSIGEESAATATAGLLESKSVVPGDMLRQLDLPPKMTWGTLAVFLRSSIPSVPRP
jgi:hypothetical protein